ncbi:MAG: FkbM family methyltransferase, partial [Gemmatimonadetes bacterium]|nr:FkbM family methyltransferase [Gemmatimonadota bacterium]
MHVLRKLSWRARFLRDPAGFLADRWDHIQRPGLRSALLEEAAATPLRERWAMLGRGSDVAELRAWMLRRLRQDGQAPFFDLGDVRLYFHPEHVPRENEGPLEGALWMIDEALVDTPEFMEDATTARPGDVVLDLGGNLGTSALLLAERMAGRGRIVSFEPVFHALLRRNLEANAVDRVEVVPAAVGAARGTATFAVTDFGLDSRQ